MANKKRGNQKKKTTKSSTGFSWPDWSSGNRLLKFIGILFILSAAILFVSFTSYFFTREMDDSWVKSSQESVLDTELVASNWMGRLGARLAHLFMFSGFGIAAFFIVGILLLLGSGFAYNRLSIKTLIRTHSWLWAMALLSLSVGFIVSFWPESSWDFLGGKFGVFLAGWFKGFAGSIGTALILFFAWLGFSVLAFDINLWDPPKPAMGGFGARIKSMFDGGSRPISEMRQKKLEARKKQKEALEKERKQLAKEESERKTILYEKSAKASDIEKEEAEKSVSVKIKENSAEQEIDKAVSSKRDKSKKTEDDLVLKIKTEDEVQAESTLAEITKEQQASSENLFDPTLELSKFKYPSSNLLEDHGSGEVQIDDEELERNKEQIIETLGHYKIDIDRIYATVGPTVTLYEIVPAPGVRISKIKNLEDDIALSLAALGIRIIAPMPGKGTIGIEVANKNTQTVSAKSLLESSKFRNSKFDLPIALGKTISNEIFIADLARMPHLLVAGATGQGKSVGINMIIASLLYKKHPSQLKFILVDPKKVELSLFRKIERHYLAKLPDEEEAIITDTSKVVSTLKSLTIEMDHRYNLLKEARARNINEYNRKFIRRKLSPEKGHHFLPFIVLVIDEFADLMMTSGKEIETPIARLAQLARATGIHLIVATQRPSVNIITGTIKANFPARIAFRVTSKVDSRTILDQGGADRLIGRGDMLMQIQSDLIRLQCAFIDTPEVERITEFIGEQQGYSDAFLLPEAPEDVSTAGSPSSLDDRDALFEEAARTIIRHQQGSTSLLQRKLKIGYNRAGRLIDQLHIAGIIGPFEGSKAREVYIQDEYQLEQFLSDLD